jgi:hypothetical protein
MDTHINQSFKEYMLRSEPAPPWLADLTETLAALDAKLTRTETRLVKLMRHTGIDAHGVAIEEN